MIYDFWVFNAENCDSPNDTDIQKGEIEIDVEDSDKENKLRTKFNYSELSELSELDLNELELEFNKDSPIKIGDEHDSDYEPEAAKSPSPPPLKPQL